MLTFEEVYKYRGVLQSYLRGKLPPADAEDVLQETFLQAVKSLHKYDPQRGGVYTWLLAILRGQLRGAYTRFRKRGELQCTIDIAYPITPYDELMLAEAVQQLNPQMFMQCSNGKERMQKLRARRKYVKEVLS
jgi:DNA-directed RNA polymerase specialized sigma24 family protein